MRFVLGLLAAALFATRALAAAPAGPDLMTWLADNTDLKPAQVAIAGPEVVYSLEPLGPPAPTGERIAHIRAEVVDAGWGERYGFRSWEAHVLIDCGGRQMRVIRSAGYSEHRQVGRPMPGPVDVAWRSPVGSEPAAQLLAAGCDPAFTWPLRAAEASMPAKGTVFASAGPREPPQARPQVADPEPTPVYAIHVARGPFEDGAKRALAAARKVLGSDAATLVAETEMAHTGGKRRYNAVLRGFPSAAAAEQACVTLRDAGQDCFTRSPASPERRDARLGSAAAPGRIGLEAAIAPPVAAYAVQVARGPFKEGAKRALAAARDVLAQRGGGLVGTVETSQVGHKPRFSGVLSGFPNIAAAAEACRTLRVAGRDCLVRAPAPATENGERLTLALGVGAKAAANGGGVAVARIAMQVSTAP